MSYGRWDHTSLLSAGEGPFGSHSWYLGQHPNLKFEEDVQRRRGHAKELGENLVLNSFTYEPRQGHYARASYLLYR